jgi:spermidine synthase
MASVPHEKVGVLGLGAGAMAAYAKPGVSMTFYEIDPVVKEIAEEHFDYLEQCGDHCTVKIGDGRQLMQEEPNDKFDIIVLDAYNSDSVPTHLLTLQAMKEVYLPKLAEDGVLVFHTSNRYLDIEGVVGRLVERLGLTSRTRLHHPTDEQTRRYIYASKYTVVAREPANLRSIVQKDGWEPTGRADVVWTDDFTNLVSIMKW